MPMGDATPSDRKIEFDIMHDMLGSGTPQMKRYGYRNCRLRTFVDPKVARSMRIITMLAKAAMSKNGIVPFPAGTPLAVELTMMYAIPKSREKGKTAVVNGQPCQSHQCGDCDNKAKLVIDALTGAGLWDDDKDICDLRSSKRWTSGVPHIHVTISADRGLDCGGNQ